MLLARTAFCDMPGVPGFWSEPRTGDLERVFLANWADNVPHDLWDYQVAKKRLIIASNPPTVVDLISRNVDDSGKKANLGSSYGWGFIDEAAVKFELRRYNDLLATVRLPRAPYLFMDTLSTPQKNGYYSLCIKPGQRVIHSSSYQNPFIKKETFDAIAASMAPEYLKQEIEGQWVSLEGKVWSTFSEDMYPYGNIHHAEWDPNRAWFLGMDIGSNLGHWQIWQYHEPAAPYKGRIAVVVAEGLQYQEPIQGPLAVIEENYRKTSGRGPAVIAIGHDVNAIGATGDSPGRIFDRMPPGWQNYQFPQKELRLKSVQHQILSGLILDNTGNRRFCISKNIRRHSKGYNDSAWGILHAMRNAQYPDFGSRDFFRKDKAELGISNTEDPQDSALYLASINHPPYWAPGESRPV
jgi:hypothetical protein